MEDVNRQSISLSNFFSMFFVPFEHRKPFRNWLKGKAEQLLTAYEWYRLWMQYTKEN